MDSAAPASKSDKAATWLSEIEQSQSTSAMQRWDKRCERILKKYLYEGSLEAKKRSYQMLWSNMETLKPSVYVKAPKAVVQRRYKDADRVGRVACEILERGVNFQVETNDFDAPLKLVRDDFLLYARATARVVYEPVFTTVEDEEDTDGLDEYAVEGPQKEISEEVNEADAAGDPQEVLDFENVKVRFVQRADFTHQPARSWDEVEWVAFRAFLSRRALVKRFGDDIGNAIELDASSDDEGKSEKGSSNDKAIIWEVWDRENRKVLWIAKGYPDVLEESDPYLKLSGFYPCPCPAFGTLSSGSLVPVPDYTFYQDQCEEIDTLTARIAALSESLKLVGFYPAGPEGEGSPEIERAVTPGFENRMIAVRSWAAFREGGPGGTPIVWLPVEVVGNILKGCVDLRKQMIEDVYQISGMSDIMRGEGDAGETATAQGIKAQYGSVRIRGRQQELARFARDIVRMTAEIISTVFQPETLEKMVNITLPSQMDVMAAQQQADLQNQQAMQQWQQAAMVAQQQGPAPMPPQAAMGASPAPMMPGQVPQAPQVPRPQVPPPPQPIKPPDLGPTTEDVFGLLRDGALRRFRIDIETDSTISGDESQEHQDRNQFIQTTTQFIQAWGPIIAQKPELAQLAGGLLLFGVRSYRVGRELEELIEETVDKIEQSAAQPKPPPPPEPDAQLKLDAVKAKTDAEIQKAQISAQQAQMEGQMKTQQVAMQTHMKQLDHDQHMQQIEADANQAEAERLAEAQRMAIGMTTLPARTAVPFP